MAYAPPLGVAMKWFPKSKGLVNGVIVGGFGLGAFIFNQVSQSFSFTWYETDYQQNNFHQSMKSVNYISNSFSHLNHPTAINNLIWIPFRSRRRISTQPTINLTTMASFSLTTKFSTGSRASSFCLEHCTLLSR